ncbi:hypothetical protein BDW59DRAFT_178388 [Aspergillus cavernicola]|uniref:Uncharacterized protein n=1 Tax=Aspergillus cavernicola TaxID=176166 RepID=A0ABR4INP8_9EURO
METMLDSGNTEEQTKPVLRLRHKKPNKQNTPRVGKDPRDGPLVPDPDDLPKSRDKLPGSRAVGLSMEEYRASYKEEMAQARKKIMELKAAKRLHEVELQYVDILWSSVDMMRMAGRTDDEIEARLEMYYAGPQGYLTPNNFEAPHMIERHGADWGQNARGFYYRHYFSPRWVPLNQNLWVPSLDDIDWNHFNEASRRSRAETFLKHVLNNEKWRKSEYAWEADAWTDVFGQMKSDPALAVDKHEYNTVKLKRHPVSCLLAGEPKFIKRIPDATFGLATFKPTDYQSALAEWDLDRDRLEALLLHRHVGLISDPRWGGTDLAFPFAVYEAKGWSGDAQEARRQACSAGAVYLDMLDDLTRVPGKVGKKNRVYQSTKSRHNQVFVFTSFGAHWHILAGYKRPRLDREFAGHDGFSESVYVFHRLWSGRVVTLRKAWELLSLVDQIHLWGATEFRNSVMQSLRQWHEFSRICYASDVNFMTRDLEMGTIRHKIDGKVYLSLPKLSLQLADWATYLSDQFREKLQKKAALHVQDAYHRDRFALSDTWPARTFCLVDDCGPVGGPGYPLLSKADMVMHYREIHGKSDEHIASLMRFFCDIEEAGTADNALGGRKRMRSGSEEPGLCTKRFKGSSDHEVGGNHQIELGRRINILTIGLEEFAKKLEYSGW